MRTLITAAVWAAALVIVSAAASVCSSCGREAAEAQAQNAPAR